MSATRGAARLVLGTAQLGLVYGVANTTVLKPEEKQALLRSAIAGGIRWLDTARAYGASELVIGQFLGTDGGKRIHVVTKLSPFTDVAADAGAAEVRAMVAESLRQSREALGLVRLDTVLLHRASHITAWNGVAWQVLRHAVERGDIARIGVSVQSVGELTLALNTPDVSHIQLPFNILDWRWDKVLPEVRQARRDRNLVVHVRSLLLQGLLTTDRAAAWSRAGIDKPEPVRAWLAAQVRRLGLTSVAHLCMAYADAQDWIDGLVVGMDNRDQLQANLQFIVHPGLTAAQASELNRARPLLDEAALDPATWARAA